MNANRQKDVQGPYRLIEKHANSKKEKKNTSCKAIVIPTEWQINPVNT